MTRRQTAFLAAKIVFAVAIVSWLFRKADASRVWNCLREAETGPVLLAVALCLSTIVIAGWRWQRLLAVFKIEAQLRSLICIAQIGQFFLVFLPGPAGDDLTRMLYISRVAKGRAGEACTSVVIDRLVGLASVLVLAVICMPTQWNLLAESQKTYWLAVGIMAAGITVCVFAAIFFLAGHPTHRWIEGRLGLLPAHTLRDEAARIWGLLCHNKRPVLQVWCAAICTHLLVCTGYYLAGYAVGIRLPLLTWLGFVPIVVATNAVPITIAGIGVREYLLTLFLGVLAHIDRDRALACSLIVA